MKVKEIKLPKAVYHENVIQRGIRDYQGICKIRYALMGDSYTCVISKSRAELNLTAKEFMNYLVEIANSRREQ